MTPVNKYSYQDCSFVNGPVQNGVRGLLDKGLKRNNITGDNIRYIEDIT